MKQTIKQTDKDNINRLINIYRSIQSLYKKIIKVDKKLNDNNTSLLERNNLKQEKIKLLDYLTIAKDIEEKIYDEFYFDFKTTNLVNDYLYSLLPDDFIDDEYLGLNGDGYEYAEIRRIQIAISKRMITTKSDDIFPKLINITNEDVEKVNNLNRVSNYIYDDMLKIFICYLKNIVSKDTIPFINFINITDKIKDKLNLLIYYYIYMYKDVETELISNNFEITNTVLTKSKKIAEEILVSEEDYKTQKTMVLFDELCRYSNKLLLINDTDIVNRASVIDIITLKCLIQSILILLQEEFDLEEIYETLIEILEKEFELNIDEIDSITKYEFVDCFKNFKKNTNFINITNEKKDEKLYTLLNKIKFD